MNRNELQLIIENAVEKKLRQLLPELIKESLTQDGTVKSVKSPTKETIAETVKRTVSTTKTSDRQFCKDPVLNSILKETVVKIKPDPTSPQVASGLAPKTNSILDKIEVLSENTNVSGAEALKPVANALTRDYSQLLKKSKLISEGKNKK